jgi:hypothetical protein
MLVSELLGLAALAVGLLPLFVLVLWVWWRRRTDRRRSPLTTELHNLPGEQARQEAERLMESAGDRMIIAVLIGPLALVGWAAQAIDKHLLRFGPAEFVLLVIVVAVACWAAWSAGRKLRERRNYLDGIAAERATAQALVPLQSKGCVVYHDLPADGFNLDHVVVGPAAVFMVETKSRRKPATRGKESATVRIDGEALDFPDWRDTRMLDQTRKQTRWLSELLYRKTGERVPVEAVLALPGWYVTCSVPSPDVHVINPKMCNFMAASKGVPIPEPQRRRIMTAIEECYSRGSA